MRTLYERHRWMQIVFGLLFLAAGIIVVALALNDKDRIATWLSIILAISLFLFGASCIFSGIFALKRKLFDPAFIYGDIAVAIGVVLCVHNQMIGDFIVVFSGTVLTTIGVVFLGEAVAMIFFRRAKFFIALFFVLGAIFITLGILSYVFSNEAQTIIYTAVGIVIALVGLLQASYGTYITIIGKSDARKDDDSLSINPEDIEIIDPQPELTNIHNDENSHKDDSDA